MASANEKKKKADRKRRNKEETTNKGNSSPNFLRKKFETQAEKRENNGKNEFIKKSIKRKLIEMISDSLL